MILKTIIEPNPILHRPAEDVSPADINTPKMQKLIKDMATTMYARDGVGIAAPQVGESIRLCVIAKNYNPFNKNKDLVLINPIWEKTSLLKVWDEEGCLSVPFTYGKVKRYRSIKVKALNEKGEPINFKVSDFAARVTQHEIDHLAGIVFIEKAKDLHTIEKQL